MKHASIAVVALIASCGLAHADFASSLVDSNGASPFGSGIVTGAPTGDGYFFPNTSATDAFITLGFSQPFMNGAGFDLEIYDTGDFSVDLSETADVFVSSDNSTFFFAGSIVGGPVGTNLIDLSTQGLNGSYSYVKVMHTSITSGDGIDLDTIEAFHIPTPATLPLLAGAALIGRRRRA